MSTTASNTNSNPDKKFNDLFSSDSEDSLEEAKKTKEVIRDDSSQSQTRDKNRNYHTALAKT